MQDIELKIVVGLHRNVTNLDKKTLQIASNYNVTFSQFMVLEALYSKGNMTVGEVRNHILSTVGTISVIIDNLVKSGYVERLGDAKDRRVSILQLTSRGEEVISAIVPKNRQMILDYMSKLSVEEKRQLLAILKKIGAN